MFVLMSNWMPLRGQHGPAIREAARSPALARLPYVDTGKLHAFADDYLAGGTTTATRCGAFTPRRAGWIFQAMSAQPSVPRIALFGTASRFGLAALQELAARRLVVVLSQPPRRGLRVRSRAGRRPRGAGISHAQRPSLV